MTDTPTSAINATLAKLQTRLPRIAKHQTANVPTKTGGSYNYNYADLAQVSREVLPLLGEHGLSFTSRPTLREGRFVLVYELRHLSGEMIAGEYPLPDRGSPQEVGGAITYARRYCLCAVTGVAPDDDDNDAALAERAVTRQRRREARAPQPAAAVGKEPAISAEQQTRLQKAFRDLGLVERDDKVKYTIGVVGRPLNSATELTQSEAGKVLQQTERDIAQRTRQALPDAA